MILPPCSPESATTGSFPSPEHAAVEDHTPVSFFALVRPKSDPRAALSLEHPFPAALTAGDHQNWPATAVERHSPIFGAGFSLGVAIPLSLGQAKAYYGPLAQ
jgi:hypothetical protein